MLTEKELEEIRKSDAEIDRQYEEFDLTGITDPKERKRILAREYYYAHREALLAKQKAWREAHKQQEQERARKYRESHREEIREKARRSREEDPLRFKEYARKCYLKKKAREFQDVCKEERR